VITFVSQENNRKYLSYEGSGTPEIRDMTTIEKTFEIKAPPDKIWSIIADRRRIPELQGNVLEVEVDPPGLAIPGQEFRFVYKVCGERSRW
jgi:hypothetical protein